MGCILLPAVVLWADTAPAITKAPSAKAVPLGQAVTFSVEATGTDPLSYQWYKDGAVISGATSSSYGIAAVQASSAGTYTAQVSNAAGTATHFAPYSSHFAAGANHSLFIKANGTLWASGSNGYGQLGNGSFNGAPSPVQIATGINAVAAGAYHTLYLKNDTTLWGAGYNSYGQLLGTGSYYTTTPGQIATDVSAVAAGAYHSLYVKSDGTLWGMGYNNSGQLGVDNTYYRTVPAQIATEVSAAAAGPYHSFFLKTNGALWAMGYNYNGELGDGTTSSRLTPVQIATGVSAVVAGGAHSLYLKTDGTLWGMGSNSFGQLGDGVTTNHLSPVQIAAGVTAMATGTNHSIFLKSDGTLWGMGSNNSGQLGDGTASDRSKPVKITAGVAAVAAGNYHSLFLKTDGTLWGMGYNYDGELGDASRTNRPTPVPILCDKDYLGVLSVTFPPEIVTPPGSTSVTAGSPASLSVVVGGTAPYTYQWRKDGVAIQNATNASFFIPSFSIANTGRYSVVVTNPAGSATSAEANLSLNLPINAAQNAISGKAVSFLAITGGSGNVNWQISTDNGTTWTDLTDDTTYAGTATTLLEILKVSAGMSNYRYRYSVGNGGPKVTSDGAKLNVIVSPLGMPTGITLDQNGNILVVDTAAQAVLKITPEMRVTAIAGQSGLLGHTDGPAASATFNEPYGLLYFSDGSMVVTDSANSTLRDISSQRVVSTVAGTAGTTGALDGDGPVARFNFPMGITVDLAGVYVVADQANHVIRQVTGAGRVITLAGKAGVPGVADGTGTAAGFNSPTGITLRRDTTNTSISWTGGTNAYGTIFISDRDSNTIRTITAKGEVGTYVGTAGQAGSTDNYRQSARFNKPTGLAFDSVGNLYIADTGNHTIRKVDPSGYVRTLAGLATVSGLMDGTGNRALFNEPEALTVDGSGNVYVSDTGNAAIRKITPDGTVTTLATLGNVPTINSQPVSQSITSGSGASFSVTASGEGNLTYQWQKNGANISGATSASYSIAAAGSADAGNYAVVVTNSWGSVTSNTASLTVSSPTPTPTPGGDGAGSSGGGGGGGGGAPSPAFLGLLGLAAALRYCPERATGGGKSSRETFVASF